MGVVFDNGSYRVVDFQGSSTEPLVITFDLRREKPNIESPAFAEAFLQKHGISYVCIRAAKNDWYQGNVLPALEAAKTAVRGRLCVGYGCSMGAYAAINFAQYLGIERCIALSPQFSMDPSKVPFEKRWRDEIAGLSFDNDRMEPNDIPCMVVYDPLDATDSAHVALIEKVRPVTKIAIPLASHSIPNVLNRCGLLAKFSLDLIDGSFNHQAFRKEFRDKRKAAAPVWMTASKILLYVRHNTELSFHFAVRASQCENGGTDAEVQKHLDNVCKLRGNVA